MKWIKIPSSALQIKAPIQLIKLEGRKFCLIYHEGNWHATSYTCPHAGANLANGWCEEGKLFCPFHRHSFDLVDGKGAVGQNNNIKIYRIEEREDGMYIKLPQSFFKRIFDVLSKKFN